MPAGWTDHPAEEPAEAGERLHVDGHDWRVTRRANVPGCHDIAWLTGPDPGYGFTIASSDGTWMSEADLKEQISAFLANIDPDTGYLD